MIRVTRTFSIRAYAFCLHWAGSEITHQQGLPAGTAG